MTDTALHMADRASGPEIDVRSRVIAEAERLFRSIGYQKTTVADIARSLKMSPANVYRFFDSKRAINEAVAMRLLDEVEDALFAIARGPGSPAQRLRQTLLASHALNAERFVGDIKLHEMVEVAMTESWDVIMAHVERLREVYERIIREGCEDGEFETADPALASHCVMAAWVRYCHPQLIAQCAEKPGPGVEEMADFILAAVSKPARRQV